MKTNVICISTSTDIRGACEAFVKYHIGTLPVVDHEAKLVGLLLIRDLLALVMPDFLKLVEDFGFVGDFGAVEAQHPTRAILATPVVAVMQEAISIEDTCGLMRAFAVLNNHNLSDLPVVDAEKHVIGIAARTDIATALFRSWLTEPRGDT